MLILVADCAVRVLTSDLSDVYRSWSQAREDLYAERGLGDEIMNRLSRSRAHQRWSALSRRFLAPFAVLLVTISLVGAIPPPASAATRNYLPSAAKATPIPHTNVPVVTPKTPAKPPAAPKATTWPAEGDADLTLAAGGFAAHAVPQRAGTLPILLGAAPTTAKAVTSTPVHVHVASQDDAHKAGVAGVLFSLSPSTPAPVSVGVDYAAFRDAGSADWSTRLQLVQLPACALTTPNVRSCQVQTPVPSTNDTQHDTVSATVPLAHGNAVFAAVAGSAGTNGTFQASSLKPSGSWSVSGAAGDFTWQYPIAAPPAASGGLAPNLSLSYDAQSVDGETAGTNNQVSAVGEGWDLGAGFIERTYRPCSEDTTLPKEQQTGDDCWAGQIVTMSLNGESTALVDDDAHPDTWRPASDNGDVVQHLYNANNGALNGEYWEVTTNDGTHYFFGRESGPGYTNQGLTNSTWTVPVYGPHPGDQCNSAAGFAKSQCMQAWRWNLDYVEDTHGNASMYYYTPETNFYGADNATTGVSYTRAGMLARIDYGLRDENNTVYGSPAPDQVVFTPALRCTSTDASKCTLTAANAGNTPDTPQDQSCASGAVCNVHTPTFWSTQRLASVTTQYANGSGGYVKVDNYTLNQSYSSLGDPALMVNSIVRTGYAADGTSLALPPVGFTYQMMDNRVAGFANEPGMSRYRLTNIQAETGQDIVVTYSLPECTASHVPADPSTDGMLCYPVDWHLPYQEKETLDYFHKYVVREVDVTDGDGISPAQVTQYSYPVGPAWHYDDSELIKPADRTYGEFRGYGEVDVLTGKAGTDQQTETKDFYYLGMDGDTLPGGKTRSVTLTNSLGETFPDNNLFTESTYESQTFNGVNGARIGRELTTPTVVATTASRARTGLPAETATIKGTAKVRELLDLASGGVRTTTTSYSYDSLGRVIQENDAADGLPDICTTSTYATSSTTSVTDKVDESIVSEQTCPAPGTALASIVSDSRSFYDGSTTLGTVGNGDVTRGDSATVNNNGTLTFATTTTATYDSSGRPLTTTDYDAPGARNGNTSTLTYTPADGGNLTKTVTTNAKGQQSSLTIDPGRNVTTHAVDVANHVTDATYDPLGRMTQEWLPNHDKNSGQQPSSIFGYQLAPGAPLAVTQKSLVDTGAGTDYVTSIKLYDSIGQLVQTQADSEGGGRVASDTFYDSHGWVTSTNNQYYTDGAPSTTLIKVAANEVNSRTVTSYDGAGRAGNVTDYNGLTATDTTQNVYSGDSSTVIPPPGGIIQSTATDARGEVTELRQYTSPPTVTGSVVSGGAYNSTRYGYTPIGQQNKITDADGNVWSYTYDMLGRQVQSSDPDTGQSSYTYDLSGNLLTSTDARGKTLTYSYDSLNRKTAEYSGPVSAGNELASWAYDTVQTGKLSYSTRYTAQGNFLVGVGAYDGAGNVSSTSVRVPGSIPGLAGTYTTNYSYTTTNLLAATTFADGGGLPGETVANSYDSLGNPTHSAGVNTYLDSAHYTPYGAPQAYVIGVNNNAAELAYDRDAQTQRVKNVTFSANVPNPQLDNTSYTYDLAGNLTSTTDVQGPAGAPTETQCDGYDALERLVQAWTATDSCANPPTTAAGKANVGGPNPFWESWSIDPTGLRKQQVQHATPGATSGDLTTNYTYPAQGGAQPHALSGTTTSGPNGTVSTSYGYNANGDTTTRTLPTQTQTLTWNDEDELATDTIGAGQTSLVYDADGSELLDQDPGSATLYLPGEELTYDNTAKTVSGTRYYSVGAQSVAVRVGGGDPVYLDGDQHGTMATVYDPDSKTVVRRQFDPYGNQVGGVTATSALTGATTQGAWPDQHGFLDDPVDTSTDLTDIGARQYDSTTGRFISVDPQLNPVDPQSMSGYAYAGDNPVVRSDPSGLGYCILMDDGSKKCNVTSSGGSSGSSGSSSKQQAKDTNAESQAEAKVGAAKVAAAQKVLHTSMLETLVKAGGDFLKGMLGITDIENCIGHGDVGSCVSLVLSILPWDRIIEEGVNLVKGIIRGIDAVRDLVKATEDAQKVMKEVSDTEQEIKDADLAAKALDDSSVSNAGHGEEPPAAEPEPNGGSPKEGGEGGGDAGGGGGPRAADGTGTGSESGTHTGAPVEMASNNPAERQVGKDESPSFKITTALARDASGKITDVWNNETANGLTSSHPGVPTKDLPPTQAPTDMANGIGLAETVAWTIGGLISIWRKRR